MSGLIKIQCGCGRNLKLKETALGKPVKCPACGEPLQVTRTSDDHFEDAVLSVLNEQTPAKPVVESSWLASATSWFASSKPPMASPVVQYKPPADEPPERPAERPAKRYGIITPAAAPQPVPQTKSFTIGGFLASVVVVAIAIPLVAFAVGMGALIVGAVLGTARDNQPEAMAVTAPSKVAVSPPMTKAAAIAPIVPAQARIQHATVASSPPVSESTESSTDGLPAFVPSVPPSSNLPSVSEPESSPYDLSPMVPRGSASSASPPSGGYGGRTWVDGYTRADGTRVEGHFREGSAPGRSSGSSAAPSSSSGRVWVNGYTKKNGTRVEGHWRNK